MWNKTLKEALDYVKGCLFEQLGPEEWKILYEIGYYLDNTRFDSESIVDISPFDMEKAYTLCKDLLKDAVVWKVEFMVMKNNKGVYENGATGYYWTEEEAEKEIKQFKTYNSGWTSNVEGPTEIPLEDADIEP